MVECLRIAIHGASPKDRLLSPYMQAKPLHVTASSLHMSEMKYIIIAQCAKLAHSCGVRRGTSLHFLGCCDWCVAQKGV